ncbi:MAG: branched-chain-amino-acid transaminase [Planctomycetes bacterium]|nr:branched-chain-amino-acid transaminase [Planctomycetota bacterium]
MKVWLNGELVDEQDAKISVFDHGLLYGDGVFEGIRVYGGRIFQCQAHVERLYASAREIRLAIPYTKQEMTDAMRQTIAANDITDGYIRLVVTRGAGTLGLNPFKCSGSNVFIIADQIALYPQEMYDEGMAVIVAKTLRTSSRMLKPSVKSLNYLNNILAKIEAVDAGVAEAIMLNEEGNVAECTGDNIFIVEDGRVVTPPPSAGILEGITRGVVIDLAGQLGIDLLEEDITVDRLYAAAECFLTGTAAEVIAVTKVNGRPIGTGRVGPVTTRLLSAFREYIQSGRWD